MEEEEQTPAEAPTTADSIAALDDALGDSWFDPDGEAGEAQETPAAEEAADVEEPAEEADEDGGDPDAAEDDGGDADQEEDQDGDPDEDEDDGGEGEEEPGDEKKRRKREPTNKRYKRQREKWEAQLQTAQADLDSASAQVDETLDIAIQWKAKAEESDAIIEAQKELLAEYGIELDDTTVENIRLKQKDALGEERTRLKEATKRREEEAERGRVSADLQDKTETTLDSAVAKYGLDREFLIVKTRRYLKENPGEPADPSVITKVARALYAERSKDPATIRSHLKQSSKARTATRPSTRTSIKRRKNMTTKESVAELDRALGGDWFAE